MRFLVLGGCGFIGSHVVDRLVAAGHDVRVVSRRGEALRGPVPGVDYLLADFREPGTLSAALAGRDCVIHAVSVTTPGTGDANPALDVSENLLPTLTLLDRMDASGVERLIYLSSGGMVYGLPQAVPIPESHPLRPTGSYGIVKTAAESYIGTYARNRGLRPVILRPSNTFGERQGRDGAQGIINTLLRKALTGGQIEIWGDGSIIRDYLDVHDLARLCAIAGESDVTGVFNAASGIGTSVRELLGLVTEISGRKLDVRFGPPRAVDVPVTVLDSSLARKVFGWAPEITLREGLARTWGWHLSAIGAR
jgi:UDP-glucose 4-epimerase